MNCKPLELEHKELLYNRLKTMDTMISEYSFANLYLFRRNHDYRVVDRDGEIFIKGRSYDGKTYYMPTTAFTTISRNVINALLEESDFIFPLEYHWVEGYGEGYIVTSNLDDADYIYTVEKMTTFKGRNLHGKRNLLKQFTENYNATTKHLTSDIKEDAIIILNKWQESTGQTKDETDYHANFDAIHYLEELSLCGIVYYVEDTPVGFIIGEELSSNTFAIHFAKGVKEYKGVYQYMYNSFASRLPKKYTYLNFEQDLGKPALRLAKSSYEPDLMLHKYRLSLNKR